MTYTSSRTWQWLGIIIVLLLLAAGYWYFSVRAGVKTNSGAVQPQGTGDLASGLAGYWKLDENTGTSAADASTNGNTGTLTNGPTWTTGQIGSAVTFDGTNDYIEIGSGIRVDNSDRGTISAWINPGTVSGGELSFFGYGGSALANAGRLRAYMSTSGDTLSIEQKSNGETSDILQATTALTVGAWYHLTIVSDGTAYAMYINGKPQALTITSGSNTGDWFADTTVTAPPKSVIGAAYQNGGLSTHFQGSLDEVRIYNRALSADEVSQLYRLTAPTGTDTSLKGYWSFNGQDMSGTTAYDRSGAGNTGTLTNGPTQTIGKLGQGLSFDGTDDYVDVGDMSSIEGQSRVTFSAWIKPASLVNQYQSIFSKRVSNSDELSLITGGAGVGDTAGVIFVVRTAGNSHGYTSGGQLSVGKWTHVVGVFDGTQAGNSTRLKIYLDGVDQSLAFVGTIPTATTANSVNLTIGGSGASDFNGAIDEARIYNRVLTAAEIKSQYDLGQSDKTNTSASQPQGTGDLSAGLAGYWKLDENTGTSAGDASTNGVTGTLTNGPTWTTGQIGSAVNLDGTNDYIELGDSSAFEPGLNLTISAWIYPTAAGVHPGIVVKSASYNEASAKYSFYLYSSSRQLGFAMGGTIRTSNLTVPLNQWSFVAISQNSAGMTFYLNGQTYSAAVAALPSYSTETLNIGSWASSASPATFTGSIDEVRLYNRGLSVDELTALYRLTTPTGVDATFDGYWSFDGSTISGTTLYDLSGRGKHGSLLNGVAMSTGKVGQALSFDGVNDRATVATVATGTTFTITAWIMPRPGGPGYGQIFGQDQNNTFEFHNSNNKLTMNSGGGYNDSNTALPDNEWSFVGISVTAGSGVFYLNGNPDGTKTGIATRNYVDIGYNGGGEYFNGKIDELRFYSRALTTAEMQTLYNDGAGGSVNTALTQPQGTGNLDSGLAGYWKLDENTGTSAGDSSTNGNNGTLTNGPTWTTGQIGSAVNFDGTDDYVTAADADSLDIVDSRNFTLSGWFNRDTFAADHTIIAKSNGQTATDTGYNVYIDDTTDKVTFVANDGTDQYKLESTSTFVVTGWNHFTIVWAEGSTTATRLYINGFVQAATATGTMANVDSLANALAFRVGAESDAGSPFDGKLDEIRLYNREFLAEEVILLYRLTAPTGTDTSLKGYWSFNGQDMNGTTAYDRSGTNNNGTLTNGPTKAIGKLGQGLSFDGTDDYVEIPNLADMATVTLSAWVKISADVTNSEGEQIISRDGVNHGAGRVWQLRVNNDEKICAVFFNTVPINSGCVTSASAVTVNTWHHVAATFNGTTIITYLDGQAGTPVAFSGSLNTQDSPIWLARNAPSSSTPFSGSIDEVRVYNRALSADEIKSLYNVSR
ncbi:MAG: LamG domain-containing protein [Flavobacteriales bacterium]